MVGGIEVGEDASPRAAPRQVLDEERKGVHVGDMNSLTLSCDRDNALRECRSVEPCIYSPLSLLDVPPDRCSAEENTRPITAVQVEGCKAEFEAPAGVAPLADPLLFLPLGNVQRNRQYGLGEPLWFCERGMPESGNPRVAVVEMEF